jgi:Mn-dependent DtxR family transcriptional regulator
MTTENAEDYLERIHELIEAKGYARVVDIAKALRLAQASVTQMVQKLDERGYVKYEKYRGVTLTPEGRRVAKTINHRHHVLLHFFQAIGVDPKAIQRDIEGIEHHLSPSTLNRIEDLTQFLHANPNLHWNHRRKSSVVP